jgi:thiamine pyrophosphate-dependent acetolactate synthase large subunit-like protein
MTPSMPLCEALARCLSDAGITTMFGLVGDANLFMADSFQRDCGGSYVAATHEAAAVLMAQGYASVSEDVGVATVTHGPALVNTLTGLIEARKAGMPLLLLAGDTPASEAEHPQDIPQHMLVAAAGIEFIQMRSPESAIESLNYALYRARSERKPVVFNMPVEFQQREVSYKPIARKMPERRFAAPESAEFENAVAIIAQARRPIIVAGRGATDPRAKAAMLKLADRIDAPLATTLKAKALFRGEPYDLDVCGTLSSDVATEVLSEADCLIAFGAGLNKFTTAHRSFLRGKRVVQIHGERGALGQFAPVDAALHGDPGLTAELILKWVEELGLPGSMFRNQEMAEKIAQQRIEPSRMPSSLQGTVEIRHSLQTLNAALSERRTVVLDGGRFAPEAWRCIAVDDPKHFVHTVNFGSIGLGMSQAIGAAFAARDRPVLLVTGDGGFAFSGLSEFNTAVRNQLDLVVVICNDGGYGAEHIQFRDRQMDPSLSLFDWPDFGPVAEALGGGGLTVRDNADLGRAADLIRDRKGPVIIDLKLDPDQIPAIPH